MCAVCNDPRHVLAYSASPLLSSLEDQVGHHYLAPVKIIWLGAVPCITPLSHEQETLFTIQTVGILASILEAVHMLCKPGGGLVKPNNVDC